MRQIGDRVGEAATLNNMGYALETMAILRDLWRITGKQESCAGRLAIALARQRASQIWGACTAR